MMNHIVYELDEFQPWPGQACYIYGTAVISYQWEEPDHSVGYRGGVCGFELQSLVISGDKEPLIIPYGSQFFDVVDRALAASDHVAQKCQEDWEND